MSQNVPFLASFPVEIKLMNHIVCMHGLSLLGTLSQLSYLWPVSAIFSLKSINIWRAYWKHSGNIPLMSAWVPVHEAVGIAQRLWNHPSVPRISVFTLFSSQSKSPQPNAMKPGELFSSLSFSSLQLMFLHGKSTLKYGYLQVTKQCMCHARMRQLCSPL